MVPQNVSVFYNAVALPLLHFTFPLISNSSQNNDILLSSTAFASRLHAENLIRVLNLFPKSSINIPEK